MTLVRRTVLALAATAALAAPFAALAQDIKPRIIRFGYGLNEQSNQGRAVKLFAEQVERLLAARCVCAPLVQPPSAPTRKCRTPSLAVPRK